MRRLAPFVLAIIIFALDQSSKAWIRSRYPLSYTEAKIEGFFNLVHAENPGAAFSMFETAPAVVRVGVLVVLALAIVALIVAALLDRIQLVDTQFARMALGLVLGGACGNLFDRIHAGTVTDFLEFYHGSYYFPAFNVADSAIFCGACLMLAEYWLGKPAPVVDPAGVEPASVERAGVERAGVERGKGYMFPKLISYGDFFLPAYGLLVALGFLWPCKWWCGCQKRPAWTRKNPPIWQSIVPCQGYWVRNY